LPEGWQLNVSAYPIDATAGNRADPAFQLGGGSAFADEKGRFVIENLAPGEYELTFTPMKRVEHNQWSGESEATHRVTVSSNGETPVKIKLDLVRRQQENRQ
jgi:hypothetical protein